MAGKIFVLRKYLKIFTILVGTSSANGQPQERSCERQQQTNNAANTEQIFLVSHYLF
jgi:hypothetical protein